MTPMERDAVPERLDRFMARANAMYYASHDPFADFTTAPEVGQVFGEIVGLWAAVTWTLLGAPQPMALVEAGPGRGTLMRDALRAIRRAAPDFAAALQVHFIETSGRLRLAQAARVPEACWHDTLSGVPEMPAILIANEFLDALPIRQFILRPDGWSERYVAAGCWHEQPVDPTSVPVRPDATDGSIVEVNEPARAFVAEVAQRVVRHPGAALFIDYGPASSRTGDSLQAIARKQPADPLLSPGSADLTAHVDFADLAETAAQAGASVQGPVTQGAFLGALGLAQRTAALSRGRSPAEATALLAAAQRLADPGAMGVLFKVLGVCSPVCPALPGLA